MADRWFGNIIRFGCFWFLLLNSLALSSQTILIQPYLQNATPQSIVIMWETDSNNESIIRYGPTPGLGSTTSGSSITTLGTKILHTVTLSGLDPDTKYYYKAITGNWQSEIFDFVTPPLRESEKNFNIALMSDMQKDGGNPNIFYDLINTSLLPYIANEYGAPLSENLQMVMIPGDVVDNGNSYLQWKNDFFNPAEILWRSVPCYPAIGNHEANSKNYFDYYSLPPNGTPGYLEHWYSHDYSNVRVLSFDSNNPYRIQAQLNWLDSMLALSCSDTLIDFVFAQMHHPHKSELWTPGEIDYTGQIIDRLEMFSDSCGKPTIHFFGHTHAYSRGQSRDHNHLWVNVATSGGNIDYWGEFSNQDYDEFIVSQDEYGFVMVEVTAGTNPKFVLKRLSFGDQYNPGGSVQTDLLTIKVNNSLPTTPYPLFPFEGDTVSSVCVTLKADGFSDPDADEHGASHWQVSLDSNFTNLIADTWKQYANWYDEVDLQANDDLTDENISGLPGGVSLWWRVRYRDKSLEWSPWSDTLRFQTRSLDTLSGNLVVNPGAETGISNWTPTVGVIESLVSAECAGINPYEGQKYFAVGALCVEHPFASAYQNIDVVEHALFIDSGEVIVRYGAYMADWQNTDESSIALQFLNANGSVISSTDTIRHRIAAWTWRENNVLVPPGTRTIKYIVMGKRFSGVDNDSYLDNLFLQLFHGDFSCTSYQSPGPLHGRIYVDKNAAANPDGKSWPTAYRSVADAFEESNGNSLNKEIWIADGVYPVINGTNRDSSFLISRKVKVYGGFNGTEAALIERNVILNQTILSGEIGDPTLIADNSYHVIKIGNTADTVLLDGLIITKGNANEGVDTAGGGIVIAPGNPGPVIIRQCRLENNFALEGSSIFNQSVVTIDNSLLTNTMESGTGNSILNTGSQADLTLMGSTVIQLCADCPQVIKSVNDAKLSIFGNVSIEK